MGGAAKEIFSQLQKEVKDDIFTPLEELAEAAVTNEVLSETMLLNASFLIDKDKEDEFDALVNEAHERWKDHSDFNYTGPWPAYNFINIRLSVEAS
ncbi:Gas vesicle synthesis protein GvpL/GvpF [Lentibacillus persicus]|uniref:Gas vesicle synthesis protein GvpL/GvpF n=1 Tax=Lentibacillus persicus TaxID=640948 RepID=A0A1I1S1P8_9BACI|nr:Gas vesicle synthesis protein GvpL/GvpF [Lentibacillus persicus]